jgi:hypothetical protein
MTSFPKVILLEGDAYLARDRITALKKSIYQETPTEAQLVTFEAPDGKVAQKEFISEVLNHVGGEIRYPTWDGEHKTIVMRGLFNDLKFLTFLYRNVTTIPEGVTLILWDETGTISAERGAKEQPSWKGLRKLCSEHGKAWNFGEPLTAYGTTDDERVSFVTAEAEKIKKKISRTDALSLIDAVGCDRGIIITELKKLALVSEGDEITRSVIIENVMPMSVDFPTWRFDSAFNSGNYKDIIEAAEMLMKDDLSEVKWDYCRILGLALRMSRWHMIVAYAAANNLDMIAEMNKFSSGGYSSKELKGIPNHAFKKESEKDCLGKPPNPYAQSDIIALVRSLISRKSSAFEAYKSSMDNFLWLYDAHSKSRMASPEEARIMFYQAIEACTKLTSIEDLYEENKNGFLF